MKYTIFFLYYDPEEKLAEMTKDSLYSVIRNSIDRDYEIIVLDRKGLYQEFNRGSKIARGEYYIFYANDVIMQDPNWLEKLCIPNTITGAWETIGPTGDKEVDGSVFCVPRDIWDKVGDWDESFVGYGWSDQDYLQRARDLSIPLAGGNIKMKHLENQTYKAYGLNIKEEVEANKERFYKKHPHAKR